MRIRAKLRFSLIILLFFSLIFCGQREISELERTERTARSVTIYRDTYGVPHIYGRTDASVIFGFMYARAEDRFFRIEDNYIYLLGRNAEVNGEGALEEDVLMRAMEVERRSKEEYEKIIMSIVDHALNYGFDKERGGLAAFGPMRGHVLKATDFPENRLLRKINKILKSYYEFCADEKIVRDHISTNKQIIRLNGHAGLVNTRIEENKTQPYEYLELLYNSETINILKIIELYDYFF